MLETMMVSSGSVMYVMAAVGILGVLAKIVNGWKYAEKYA